MNYKIWFLLMLIPVVCVGILQFFAHPQWINYILLFTALVFGVLGALDKMDRDKNKKNLKTKKKK